MAKKKNSKIVPNVTKEVTPIVAPVVPLPPELSKENQEAIAKQLKAKYEYIANQAADKSDFRGSTSNGDPMFGNPLDGFTPGAINSLLQMAEKTPKIKELFTEQAPIQNKQEQNYILPNSNVKNEIVIELENKPSVDVLDIFGIK